MRVTNTLHFYDKIKAVANCDCHVGTGQRRSFLGGRGSSTFTGRHR